MQHLYASDLNKCSIPPNFSPYTFVCVKQDDVEFECTGNAHSEFSFASKSAYNYNIKKEPVEVLPKYTSNNFAIKSENDYRKINSIFVKSELEDYAGGKEEWHVALPEVKYLKANVTNDNVECVKQETELVSYENGHVGKSIKVQGSLERQDGDGKHGRKPKCKSKRVRNTEENMKLKDDYTSDMELKCVQCNYTTYRPDRLRRHMCTHTKQYPLKCVQCTYGTTTSSKLKIHMMTHTGEKPFKCNDCAYSTTSNSLLQRHIRCRHSRNRTHTCDLCGRSYADSNILKKHRLTHSDAKPYVCVVCHKGFVQSCYLKYHMDRHHDASNEPKAFRCDECDFTSTSANNVKQHKTFKHSCRKPFQCEVCSYTSVTSRQLKNHMYTHGREKPFKCYNCSYQAVAAYVLIRHIEKHHA